MGVRVFAGAGGYWQAVEMGGLDLVWPVRSDNLPPRRVLLAVVAGAVVALGMIATPYLRDSQAMSRSSGISAPGGALPPPLAVPREDLLQLVRVKSGDTLTSVLDRGGATQEEARGAANAIADLFDPHDLRPDHEVTLLFNNPANGGEMTLKRVSLDPGPGYEVVATRAEGGDFTATEKKVPLRQTQVRAEAVIETSLYEATEQAGVPASLLSEVVRAFSYDVDFQRDLQPGDRFEVLYDRFETPEGVVAREGEVSYAALTLSGKKMMLYRFVTPEGTVEYYNEKGQSVRKALLKTPIDGARLSSGFGMRKHPILGYSRMHRGVDFAAATGTPIFAAGDGKVETAGAKGSYGTYVLIRHTGAYATAYAHLSRIAQGVRPGKAVRQGQVIGYVGTTGSSTGPHLHFEVIKDGGQINPSKVKFSSGMTLAGKDMKRFTAARDKIMAQFAHLPPSTDVTTLTEAR